MILVSHSREDLKAAGSMFFVSNGIECAVAHGDHDYLGFIISEDGVYQVATGYEIGWVGSVVEQIAQAQPRRPSGLSFGK